MCAHVCTRDQVNNCGIDGGLALPESSPVLSIIGGTSVCLHLTLLHFGAVTGTPTILVITPLQVSLTINSGNLLSQCLFLVLSSLKQPDTVPHSLEGYWRIQSLFQG